MLVPAAVSGQGRSALSSQTSGPGRLPISASAAAPARGRPSPSPRRSPGVETVPHRPLGQDLRSVQSDVASFRPTPTRPQWPRSSSLRWRSCRPKEVTKVLPMRW